MLQIKITLRYRRNQEDIVISSNNFGSRTVIFASNGQHQKNMKSNLVKHALFQSLRDRKIVNLWLSKLIITELAFTIFRYDFFKKQQEASYYLFML